MISTNEFFQKLDRGRKCADWESVPRVNVRRLVKKLQYALQKIPMIHGVDLWDNPITVTPLTDFNPHLLRSEFILVRDYKTCYYVDTQGYSYCRYAIELINIYQKMTKNRLR